MTANVKYLPRARMKLDFSSSQQLPLVVVKLRLALLAREVGSAISVQKIIKNLYENDQ
jgi:hypothetical protein